MFATSNADDIYTKFLFESPINVIFPFFMYARKIRVTTHDDAMFKLSCKSIFPMSRLEQTKNSAASSVHLPMVKSILLQKVSILLLFYLKCVCNTCIMRTLEVNYSHDKGSRIFKMIPSHLELAAPNLGSKNFEINLDVQF